MNFGHLLGPSTGQARGDRSAGYEAAAPARGVNCVTLRHARRRLPARIRLRRGVPVVRSDFTYVFVAYGIGVPVLVLNQDKLLDLLVRSGQAVPIAKLF